MGVPTGQTHEFTAVVAPVQIARNKYHSDNGIRARPNKDRKYRALSNLFNQRHSMLFVPAYVRDSVGSFFVFNKCSCGSNKFYGVAVYLLRTSQEISPRASKALRPGLTLARVRVGQAAYLTYLRQRHRRSR